MGKTDNILENSVKTNKIRVKIENKICFVGMAFFDRYITSFKRWFYIHKERIDFPIYILTNNVDDFDDVKHKNLILIDIKSVCDKNVDVNKYESALYNKKSIPYRLFPWNVMRYLFKKVFDDGFREIIYFENDSIIFMNKQQIIDRVEKIPINHVGYTHQSFQNTNLKRSYNHFNDKSKYYVQHDISNKICAWEGPVFVLKFDDKLYNNFLEAFDILTPLGYTITKTNIVHPQNIFCYVSELFGINLFKWTNHIDLRRFKLKNFSDDEFKNTYDFNGIYGISVVHKKNEHYI